MANPKEFIDTLRQDGITFFAGVPDSLLRDFCACVGDSSMGCTNVIAANEGNAVGMACGWYLSTGSPAAVYMQNSGEGNAVNPLLSLADPEVYSIPMLLIIGWRGQPGKKDEPQHVKQGKVTCRLLETMDIPYCIADNTWRAQLASLLKTMEDGECPVAFVVPKGYFDSYPFSPIEREFQMTREESLAAILECIDGDDIVVSTTGKCSRELFELREARGESHERDFLTVGGMGHTSSIAFGASLGTERTVWCIDGDGSMIMHMGALAVIAQASPQNFKYVVNDNAAHESVGGQPTASPSIDIPVLLQACGFSVVEEAESAEEIRNSIVRLRNDGLGALVLRTRQGSRGDLGRPSASPAMNKEALMRFLAKD